MLGWAADGNASPLLDIQPKYVESSRHLLPRLSLRVIGVYNFKMFRGIRLATGKPLYVKIAYSPFIKHVAAPYSFSMASSVLGSTSDQQLPA